MRQLLHRLAVLRIGFILVALSVAAPFPAHAAQLLLDPSGGGFANGLEFTVKVMVDPAGADVNAADGAITFDKDFLSVSKISKDGSAFSLWTADPTFSNSAGTINFSGGTPSAFSKKSTVITITFKGKALGVAKASFSKGSVLAADGKGTDVYEKGNEAAFDIIEAPKTEAPEEEEIELTEVDSTEGILPVAPTINSSTHAKPENWYATSTAIFTWKLPPDATGVRTLLSRDDGKVPTEVLAKDAVTQTLTALEEGVWYYYVQVRNEFGWGEVGKKIIQIDTVPPEPFDIFLDEAGDVPMLKFKTEDITSGVDRYEIVLGSTTAATVRAQDLVDGAPVPPQDGGLRTVIVKAYDKASNVTAITRDFELPKVKKANKGEEEEGPPPIFTIERILTILFALAIGALTVMLMQLKKKMAADKSALLNAVMEMREKNDKVFSAMREEFEQMINAFDVRPQLTPEERALLEEIKEVLDISEELVDSGIEDLKKRVRAQ